MSNKYRVALIGCGSLGAQTFEDKGIRFAYNHLEVIVKNAQCQLAAVVDTDLDKAKPWAERFNVPAFSDFREMLDAVKPDIVNCTAGPDANVAVIPEAVKHGVKGIYCEKPMCKSLEEADMLVELERQHPEVKMQVDYRRNFDTFHNSVVKYIRDGKLGNFHNGRTTYQGGILAVFPHTTALLEMIFDGAKSVSGVYSPIKNITTEHDPNIDGTIRYHFAPQSRDVNVQLVAGGRGKDENNTYVYELEFTGSQERLTVWSQGHQLRRELMQRSDVFWSVGITEPYETRFIPPEIKSHAQRTFLIEGMERLIKSIETNTSTDCTLARARNAEEVAHALAISASKYGLTIDLPLKGEDRKHFFKHTAAGIGLLRQQGGIVTDKK